MEAALAGDRRQPYPTTFLLGKRHHNSFSTRGALKSCLQFSLCVPSRPLERGDIVVPVYGRFLSDDARVSFPQEGTRRVVHIPFLAFATIRLRCEIPTCVGRENNFLSCREKLASRLTE